MVNTGRDHVPVPDERGDRGVGPRHQRAPGWSPARSSACAGFWAQVEALDGQVDVATQIALLLEGRKLTERAVRWLLHNRRPPFDIQATIDFFADGVRAVGASLPKLLTGRDLAGFTERQEAADRPGRARGPGRAGGRDGARLLGVRRREIVAADRPADVEETAEVYFDLADRLQIARLRDQIVALPRDDRWNTMARGALRDDLYAAHAALARDVLMVTGPGSPGAAAGGLGRAQRGGGAAGRADPDRDLGDRPVHGGHAVGGGPGHPHPGGGRCATGTCLRPAGVQAHRRPAIASRPRVGFPP